MVIRKTKPEDLPFVMEVYAAARKYMRSTGNMHQWRDDYPSAQSLASDMSKDGSYVCCLDDGTIAGTFFFLIGEDPTYNIIYEGSWPDDSRYGVVHRVASDGRIRHMLSQVMDYCFRRIDTIRVDTHRDNSTMRNALTSYGFSYCGIIHIADGSERLAYQMTRTCL